jgi:hypothetical protein
VVDVAVNNDIRITKLEVWKNGNGSKGAEQRLQEVEERVKPENCLGRQAIKEYLDEQEERRNKRRSFRMGDIANVIQLILLATVIYELFSK